ncbi:DUF3466 family protein [Vibrio metschnikovii]|uniref:DUF3466 family protein n=1 Tax=Vibrio metschnikovii TaxID=28172 RepID=UPI0028790267|nr:DUF3466 family protein [Vibrio metschnikovii]EKO3584786.1 DUF3466 family protein [Vibrio metschnikovii]EKO3601889.1 DUF3466 family protein [Vibrio metschnikovii]EKQ5809336.1 DUF3466 family protein [Vibrio metschnikovii]ELF5341869.1 DUF3466 family protein [Vibrio metschnikovii]
MKPISSNMFKLTAISAMILSTTSASAALYQVIEVKPQTTFAFESVYGVAIQPGNVADDKPLGCFADDVTTDCKSSFKLAGETRLVATHAGQAIDGLSYREEAPFGIDNGFIYVQDDERDFERYCRSELRYAICETWADIRWNIWKKEISGDQTPNAIAFVEEQVPDIGVPIDETKNVVVNSLTANAEPIGITLTPGDVTGSRRNSVKAIGIVDITTEPESNWPQTRAWKTDGTYTVGSIAHEKTNNQGNFYTSKGAIWDSSGTITEIPWQTTNPERDNRLAQGSLRDVTIKDGNIYAVGYNTFYDDRNFMQASVSSVKVGESNWITKPVTGATVRENGTGGDFIHSHSLLTAVNEHGIAIGEAKLSRAESGAYANRLFVVPDINDPKANFLNGSLFFAGAGGKAGAINNFNEIVGQIDTEETREVGGKPRRKRGFIYPYGTELQGSIPERQAIFNNRAWLLDDLTNGSEFSDNNQYRIIAANDINDAGVIAATALKCTGGYDSTAHNAQCGAGKGQEKTVAVKLVPIAGKTHEDISPRGMDDLVVERNGAGLGLWSLILGGLLWFRRK